MIRELLQEFISKVENKQIEIYNEFSLQHELGIFLREQLPKYKIQFERNTKFFGINETIKHEIDIVIYNNIEKYAIELKYPLNGQYPEQMYSFIKDIKFMEQLKINGFNATYTVIIVNDKNFYTGKKIDGIYAYFRGDDKLEGTIKKPTGNKEEYIILHGKYNIKWEGKNEDLKYYILGI